MAMVVMAFWGCKEDTQPRLDKDPSTLTFIINTPPMANQWLYLSDGNDATFDLSCSQPNYGFSAVANYVVMVSLSEDFTHNAKFAHEGEDSYFPQAGDYVELRDPGTLANMQIKQLYLTRAICKLLTYTNDGVEYPISTANDLDKAMAQKYADGYMPVYVKIRCYIPQDEAASSVVSQNFVKFSHVVPVFSLEVPSSVYMTGNFNEWPAPGEVNIPQSDEPAYPQVAGKLWPLTELVTEIDSKIFRNSFYLKFDAGNEFRFYQIPPATVAWGAKGSLGGSEEDFTYEYLKLSQGTGTNSVVTNGQGNFKLVLEDESMPEDGWYDMILDLNESTFTVSKVSTPTYPTTYSPE